MFQHDIRYNYLLNELKRKDATFVCLHEVTKFMMEHIRNNAWIRKNYYLHTDKWSKSNDLNVLLSKIPAYKYFYFSLPKLSKNIITNLYKIQLGDKHFTMSLSAED